MIDEKSVEWLRKYHRATNYLAAAMLYLKDNFLLQEELSRDHIKDRLLGHWGTVPGLNFIYGGLNHLIKETGQETMLIIGPGHGAPAVLANQFLEGTLGEFYEKYRLDYQGLGNITKDFSWPGGMPSHTYPGVPGNIHEGGELGYSLGTAFGAAFDNPDLMVACVVGDGEAETGPLAASWHSNKFLNPTSSGSVLPILHLNGYRISGPTLFGTMTEMEIKNYFAGLGYEPIFVDQYESEDIYKDWLEALHKAHQRIKMLKETWDKMPCPCWPMIVLKTKKGWTMPEYCGETKLEDHNNSHGVPLSDCKKNEEEFTCLKEWLESYKIEELLKEGLVKHELSREEQIEADIDAIEKEIDGVAGDMSSVEILEDNSLLEYVPTGDFRMGMNKHAFGGDRLVPLDLPEMENHEVPMFDRGSLPESGMEEIGEYFRDIIMLNEHSSNFRLFSPDETESNKLQAVYEATNREFHWPIREFDENYSSDGRLMEILSENVLQEWFEGYVKTGRHGVLISYEAFLGIITSQIDQYIKYMKQSLEFDWRKPVASLNYIATSTGWRQDHNGFTHQNPSLISSLLVKQTDHVSIYLPADVNTLLASMHDSFTSLNRVNLVISGKRDLPQWLTLEEAKEHVEKGIGEWEWAGNYGDDGYVDIVLASAGDYQTHETLAAAQLIMNEIPELKFKYININELTILGMGDEDHPNYSPEEYTKYFTADKQVIFNFHGYPEVIKQLTWGTDLSNRTSIHGYIEQGTTTTPFDMQVLNKTSRYHLAIEAVTYARQTNQWVVTKADEVIKHWQDLLTKHEAYIVEHGVDIPEVLNFKFNFPAMEN